MKTYIIIELVSGTYIFKTKKEINPGIWIPEYSPNIHIRVDEKLTCTKMSGDAWKFTRDPFRDTYEVHCEGSRPVRVGIYQKGQDRVLRTLFDYHISEQEYLSDGRIVLRIGDTPEENLEDIKETVLNKLSGLS